MSESLLFGDVNDYWSVDFNDFQFLSLYWLEERRISGNKSRAVLGAHIGKLCDNASITGDNG